MIENACSRHVFPQSAVQGEFAKFVKVVQKSDNETSPRLIEGDDERLEDSSQGLFACS